ncbi:MAG: hypothetical protein ACYTKD_13740 [Planctomycetota bacterium]|jgi:hypothetical protein
MWALARAFSFDMGRLASAVSATFERRGTGLPVALTSTFAEDRTKVEQWHAFLRRTELDPAPPGLDEAVSFIARFIGPVIEHLNGPEPRSTNWPPGGPWE